MRFSALLLALLASTSAGQSVTIDRLVRVYDGDTITVDIDTWPAIVGDDINIRVRGLDTPEIRGKCESEKAMARVARDRLRLLLESAETIELVDYERGKYFRLVATVIVDGNNVAETMIQEKLARPYNAEKRQSWCEHS